jgi:hypothetical protein
VPNLLTRAKITSIVVPEGITTIDERCFEGCESLTTVQLPSTLKLIDYRAFADCKDLANVEISKNIEFINYFAFDGCEKLYTDEFMIINNILTRYRGENKVVEIPEGVTYIATAFCERRYVKEIILPSTLEKIGESAFDDLDLEIIDLPESVKSIGQGAFYGCRKLREIHLNTGLVNIEAHAFEMVPVRNIIIPETVTTLGAHAFDYCFELRDISVPNSVKKIGKNCFGWNGSNKIIHTTEDAPVVQFVKKNCPEAVVQFDYGKEDYR